VGHSAVPYVLGADLDIQEQRGITYRLSYGSDLQKILIEVSARSQDEPDGSMQGGVLNMLWNIDTNSKKDILDGTGIPVPVRQV
jgi:hypothetical protein